MSNQHARLAPSSAERWCTCPGSVARTENMADVEGEEAKRGTEAHEFLEAMICRTEYVSPKNPLIDADDVQAVHETLSYITVATAGGIPAKAEVKVDIGKLWSRTDCWGTMDVQVFKGTEIELIDYKNGFMIVEPFENKQLMLYAIGVMQTFANPFPDDYPIRLTIAQPRPHAVSAHPDGPIRSWVTTYRELMGKWAVYFALAAEATDDPNAAIVPSEEGCKWCLCKATCPELEQQSLAAAQAIFDPFVHKEDLVNNLQANVSREPDALTEEQIAFVLDHTKMIKGWLDAVAEYALDKVNTGGQIKGFKLVKGKGSRAWKGTEDEISTAMRRLQKADGKRIGKADVTIEKLMSPAQAEKRLKPLMELKSWTKISDLIEKKTGKPALAPLSDPRPAISTNAAEVFADVNKPAAEALPSFLQ